MKKNVINMRNRVHLTLFFSILFLCNFANAQSGFILEDTIISKLAKCGGKADICINNVTPAQLAQATISVNGSPYSGALTACKTDTILAYDFSNFNAATPPPYKLDSLTINGKFYGGKDIPSLEALADSLAKWDPKAGWAYNSQTKKMTGVKTSFTYSPMKISTTTIVSENTVGLNTGIESKGVKFSFAEGTYKIVVKIPALNQSDSLYLYVVCPQKDIVSKTIKVGQSETFCINKKDLPAGKVLSLKNYNPIASNSPISATFLAGDSCVTYKGLSKGKDTLLLVASGQNAVIDTTILYINVEAAPAVLGTHIYSDNVYEGTKEKYCIPTSGLLLSASDTIKSITNICPTKSGKEVKFTIDNTTACVEYEGLIAGGLDTACIVITNNKGKSDTTNFYIKVVKDCKNLVKLDSAVTYVADCSLKGQICFPDFKPADTLKYTILADGNIYIDDKVGCAYDTIIAYNYSIMLINGQFLPPPYSIDQWTINGKKYTGSFDEIKGLVAQMNIWDPKGKWELDTAKQLIVGGVPSQKYSPINITNQTFLVESELGFNIGLNAKGLALSFEKGLHQVVFIENATGCTDTVRTFVSCLSPDYITEQIVVGTKDTVCLDISQLFSDPATTVNILNDSKNPNVTFTVSADKKCIYYTGNIIGSDTAVIVACDKYKYCDTTYIYVDVVKKTASNIIVVKDTIFVGDNDQYCIDTLKYLAAPAKFVSANIKNTKAFADFTLDAKTYCLKYTGTKATGTDTAYVYFCSTVKCDTFQVLVTVKPKPAPNDVVIDTIPLLTSNTYCLPASKYTGVNLTKIATVKNTCEKVNGNVTYTIQKDTTCKSPNYFGYSLTYKGNKIGQDTACVEVTDSTGKKATLKVVVYVTPRKPYIVNDTVLVGGDKLICLEDLKLDITSNIDSVKNFCPVKAQPFATFAVQKSTNCKSGFGILVTGIKVGKDTACFVVIDKYGNKDTANFYINVIKPKAQPKVVYDTIVVYQTHDYCIDPLGLGISDVDTVYNACPKSSGKNVVFSLSKKPCTSANGKPGITITYTGTDEIGTDTACWVIKGKNGVVDTVTTIVTVRKPSPSIIKDTVEVGGTITICPDFKELDTVIDSVYNACPKNSGSNVKVTIDKATNCVKFEGLVIGVDTVCLVLIDQFGLVDTTTMIVTVVPKGTTKIIAVDDAQTIPQDQPATIKILANDTVTGASNVKITIIPLANGGKGPKHGAVTNIIDSTGSVIYMPDFGFCGKDTFTYQICSGTICDTADVIVTIKCEEDSVLIIYNGFSPNDDNTNSKFTIKGITNPIFNGNTLVIFNRWGNEVYRKDNYDNSFDGTWNGGQSLPDGTYYYVLCLPDKQIKSGFLEIRR